jgi:hypothetical protein
MIDAGIHEGDLVVVERGKEPKVGQIVVGVLDGEFTLKRLRKEKGKFILHAENPAYPDLHAYNASKKLAEEYGEPEVLKGYGRRNTTLLAVAPTKSSAFILGQVSEGIEPHRTNYYIKDLQKGKFTIKNKDLEGLLKQKGFDTNEIWYSFD